MQFGRMPEQYPGSVTLSRINFLYCCAVREVSRATKGADRQSAAVWTPRRTNTHGNPLRNLGIAISVADRAIKPAAFRHAGLIGTAHARRFGGGTGKHRRGAPHQMNDQPGGVQHRTLSVRETAARREVRRNTAQSHVTASPYAPRFAIPPSRRASAAAPPAAALPSPSPASRQSPATRRRQRTRSGKPRSYRWRRSRASRRSYVQLRC